RPEPIDEHAVGAVVSERVVDALQFDRVLTTGHGRLLRRFVRRHRRDHAPMTSRPAISLQVAHDSTTSRGTDRREIAMTGQRNTGRRVVAQISMTLDGRVSGPGGAYDMELVAGHATTDAAHQRGADVLGAATTAFMGRGNYEGFYGYWP